MRTQLGDGPSCWRLRMEMPTVQGWVFSPLAAGGQVPMQSRRKLLLMLTACCAAFCFVVASVLADELLGVLTKVDVEGKKITVVGKDEKKVEIKVNDETEYPTKKDTKYDLKKLEEAVEEGRGEEQESQRQSHL